MRVLAVAVTYHPDATLLAEVLRSVSPQVQGVVVIDNGSADTESISSIASELGAHLIVNTRNLGIAAAQNQGVAFAQASGFSHILLLDQDTIVGPAVVASLAESLAALEERHCQVAAVGPAYYEINSQQRTRAYRAEGIRILRVSLESGQQPEASDFIIASGSLIPLQVLNHVGGFREDLFIDVVDVEWCFRARAAGYQSFLLPTATVDHYLGTGTAHLGPIRIARHAPIRNYYWVRNALWLARQPYTPLAWRLYFISRSLAFLGTYTTVVDKRILRLRLMCRGILDSFRGQFGPLK